MVTSKHHALAREAIIAALTAYTGITTADGATPANNTLVCATLINRNDFISNKSILIGSGDADDESSGVSSFATLTGIITVTDAFSAQIKAGTLFRILNISIGDLAAIKTQVDKLAGWEIKDTHAHANNIVWQEVLVITTTTRKLIKNIWLDFVNLTQNMEYRLSYKIDETNYRVFDSNAASPWTPAADDGVLIYCDFIISSDFKLELKSAVVEGAARDIPYEVDGEDME